MLTTIITPSGVRYGSARGFRVRQTDGTREQDLQVIAKNGIEAVRIARRCFEQDSRPADTHGINVTDDTVEIETVELGDAA